MADHPPISVLYMTVLAWAQRCGGDGMYLTPGLWRGETDQWKVAINPRREPVEDVEPYHMHLTHKTALIGLAVIGPAGGCIAGPTEDDLIAHFEAANPEGDAR